MRLWIAEKPDAGRNIAKALGGGREQGGHIVVNGQDTVTWAIGHLLESMMPDEYDERWKAWSLDHLPIIPDRFQYKPIENRRSQLATVTKLIRQAHEIVIACDAGREGEAIAWLILDHAGWKGPVKRFWTSSLTPSALAKAVNNLIDDRDKKPLYIAARLRSSIDWLDGINWSRYYNLRSLERGDKVISIGRVQTATLALVVDRDHEIDKFRPEDYFDIKATIAAGAHAIDLWHAPRGEKRISSHANAQAIAQACSGQHTELQVEAKPKRFAPPPPYSLPELQIHASAKWGWTSDATLQTLQKLYEAGAVTYPRTDSAHLTSDMKADIPRHLAALRKRPNYQQIVPDQPVYRDSIFDDSKVTDHHGIIPTEELVDIAGLGQDGMMLFDLIARRFIAAMMDDAEGSTTTVKAVIAGYGFQTSGTIITVPGWKAAWDGFGDPDEEPDTKAATSEDTPPQGKILPPVRHGDQGRVERTDITTRTTRPPPRYTEGSLIKAMMAAGSKNPDAEIRDLLSNGGLGTGATRQEAIKKLKMRGFIEPRGKALFSSNRAREFIAIIRKDGNKLADVVATAELERELRRIEQDPSTAAQIWQRHVSGMRSEISQVMGQPVSGRLTRVESSDPKVKAFPSRTKSPESKGFVKKDSFKRKKA